MKINEGKTGVFAVGGRRLAVLPFLVACVACALLARGEDRKERVLRRLEAVKVENVPGRTAMK